MKINKISELTCILGESFAWNKARLDCFAKMLIALFVVRTVNLSELAIAFVSKAKPSSSYKRLQRFFKQFSFDQVRIAHWIFALFFLIKKRFTSR